MKKPYKLVRVTTILDFVNSHWKQFWWRSIGIEAADVISKQSSEFGIQVHSFVEDNLTNKVSGFINIETPKEKCSYKIIEWMNNNNVKPLFYTWDRSLEVEVEDKKLGLIGHFDCAAEIADKYYIIDFKTSEKMRKNFPLQIAAYAKMASDKFDFKIDNGLTLRSHWNEEKKEVEFEVKEYNNLLKVYWPIFKKCLDIYKYFTRKTI